MNQTLEFVMQSEKIMLKSMVNFYCRWVCFFIFKAYLPCFKIT